MIAPQIDNSIPKERLAYVLEAWKCLHDCEACGKCRILKGRDAEILYADYIEGKRSYMDIAFETTPLITHRFPLSEIEEAYRIFENKLDGVIKVAIV